MAHTVIGTAGHIDHGKTLIVKALTGTDTDRAPEEKARGITIELGFAFLGEDATIIDVPGHERFVKTMVAGVSTIDVALLVIAADDGVMPQSREHLDVLELLGVPRGIIVVNKTDLVDNEWLQMVEEDVRELVSGTFLETAEILRVSAMTGGGIPELRKSLSRLIGMTEDKRAEGPFRLPVDRAFVVKGFGMVCTGTVLSGELKGTNSVTVHPAGRQLRIRGLQKHGEAVKIVSAGDRAAVNLPRIDQDEISRGDVLCERGVFSPTSMVDSRLRLLPSCPKGLAQRARVRVHLGTAETLGRIVLLDREVLVPGESAAVQIRLESPVVAAWGDRFVIRRYSPALTIGGGYVLHPHPKKHGGSNNRDAVVALQQLDVAKATDAVAPLIAMSNERVARVAEIEGTLALGAQRLAKKIQNLETMGEAVVVAIDNEACVVSRRFWQLTADLIQEELSLFHASHPLKKGRNREELRTASARHLTSALFERILEREEAEGRVAIVGNTVSLVGHEISFSAAQMELRDQIEKHLRSAKFGEMPDVEELARRFSTDSARVEPLLRALQTLGVIIYLDRSLILHKARLEGVRQDLRKYLDRQHEITVSQFRELIDSNRRYALALLNHFDGEGFTVRKGDVRALR